jgi:KipI family sensor histidine kinase inhibitor
MVKKILGKDSLPEPTILPYGDSAISLSYKCEGYNAAVNTAVLALAAHLRTTGTWEDVVSAYDSLVARFNPSKVSLDQATKNLTQAVVDLSKSPAQTPTPRTIDVPVYYGGKEGPDIDRIARSSGLSIEKVIKTHSAQPYKICMMGFLPGFTFLSETPKALHHPRLTSPRLSVPAGSIGIAGWQTGLYGLDSPGGWQVIGRTPLKIFDTHRHEPFLWQAGDYLRFIPQDGAFPNDLEDEGLTP